MLTDDMRRYVAGELREVAGNADSDGEVWVGNLMAATDGEMGMTGGYVTAESVERLADLIDRPTCRMRFDAVHQDFACSSCGHRFDGFQTYDGHGHWDDFRYCPMCGAQVVS